MKRIELKGKRYGRLTVIKYLYSKSGAAYWLCKCDCENETTATTYILNRGSKQSCGCLRKEISSKPKLIINLIGQTFNRLTVIEKAERTNNPTKWICKCACGNTVVVYGHFLKNGSTKSCGCIKLKHLKIDYKNNIIYKPEKGEEGLNFLFKKYQTRAKRKDLPFELTIEEFKKLTSSTCFYGGETPSNRIARSSVSKKPVKLEAIKYSEYIYNGVDRLNSNIGYTINNCVPCCYKCNIMKNDMTLDEFEKQIINIFYHRNLKVISDSTEKLVYNATKKIGW